MKIAEKMRTFMSWKKHRGVWCFFLIISLLILTGYLAVFRFNISFIDARHRTSYFCETVEEMDSYKIASRLVLEKYIRQADIEKLAAIEAEFHSQIGMHDQCKERLSESINKLPSVRSDVYEIWQKAMSTVIPEFDRQAKLLMSDHRRYLQVRGDRLVKMEKHEDYGKKLKELLVDLQDIHETETASLTLISRLDQDHFAMVHADDQFIAKIEFDYGSCLGFIEDFVNASNLFKVSFEELKALPASKSHGQLLAEIFETFKEFDFTATGQGQLFELHQEEIILHQKVLSHLDAVHELGDADTAIAAEIMNLVGSDFHHVMSDIILEVTVSVILFVIVIWLWHTGKKRKSITNAGWDFIVAGFVFLLIGSLFDITDNFEFLGRFVIVGHTEAKAFLEIMGFLGGYFLIATGMVRWIPSVTSANDLRRSEEKYRTIVERTRDVICTCDCDWRITYISPQISVSGFSPEDITGHHFLEFVHPDDVETASKEFRKTVEAGTETIGTFRIKTRDGSYVWYETTMRPLHDGEKIVGTVAVSRDVSERIKVTEALRLTTRAINAAKNGILICRHEDNDHPISYANPAFEDITGYPVKEVIGKDPRFLQGKDSEGPELEEIRKALNENRGCGVVLRNYRKDGTVFWNEMSISPVTDADGNVTHYLGSVNDVTERIETEEQLHQARMEAEAANEAKSSFLANMSHEIRTPMNAIIALSKTLGKQNSANLTQRQLDGLNMIHQSGQHLLLLINDILDLSKVEAGKVAPHLEAFYLDKVIDAVSTLAANLIGDSPIGFTVHKSDDLPEVIVSDSLMLHQILVNVVGNSIKFTEEGRVTVSIYGEDDELYFAVEDTGIGIEAGDVENIFTEFMQVDSSPTRKYPGTGLGLAICNKLLNLLGGGISAESRLGEGTKVTFHIPLVVGESSQVVSEGIAAGGEAPAVASDAKVLIAEDDEFGRAALEMMLEGRYHLIFAVNGLEAVEKYIQYLPDIVLMDIMMPVVDGYHAYNEIRACEEKAVPIIALTAKAMKKDRRELLKHGFTDFVAKPIDDEVLIKTIDKYLHVAAANG